MDSSRVSPNLPRPMKTPKSPDSPAVPEGPDPTEWLEIVRDQVSKLRYGSVQITVHDGRVTQVESTERTRFAATPKPHG